MCVCGGGGGGGGGGELWRRGHVWAGISKKGATAVCIFEGIMAAPLYCKILERTLLPFIRQKFPPPCTHRYIQDNDPKHTSRPAQNFYSQSGINNGGALQQNHLFLNPIENLWHELKEYVRREVKPTTKLELVNGIITLSGPLLMRTNAVITSITFAKS